MNVRHAILACVAVTALGQLGGAACGGHLDATGPGGSSTNDASPLDATSPSSTGGSGSGRSGPRPGSNSGSSGGASGSGGSSSSPPSSSSSSGGGSSSSDGSAIDGNSGSSSGNSPESGAPDSGADTAAGDALGGLDAAGDAGGAIGYDSATGCGSAAVSFSADIMPIFQRSCTLSTVCHGQMNNAQEENLYLGKNGGGGGSADSYAVYSGLVGVHSKEDPSMNLVTAGDTSNSFLWHKVNDDQMTLNSGTLATGCMKASAMCFDCTTDAPCGGAMPYLGEPLAADDLCTIESWIAQGAPND